jgi:hypothetical protein
MFLKLAPTGNLIRRRSAVGLLAGEAASRRLRAFTFGLKSLQRPFSPALEHFPVSMVALSQQEETMQLKTIALATAFTITSSLAFAQMGGNDSGATVPERSGTAVNGSGGSVGTVDNGRMRDRAPGATTGMAPTAPSGPGVEPGSRDESRVGGRGVNDRPGD